MCVLSCRQLILTFTNMINKILSIKKKVIGGFSCALVMLFVSGVLSYFSVNFLSKTTDQRKNTVLTLKHLEDIVSVMKDAETGQRGYIITGKELHLKPYTTAITKIDEELLHVKESLVDNQMALQKITILE